MSLDQELDLASPIKNRRQRALISVVLTGSLLSKEGDRLFRPYGLTDAQFNILMLLKYQTDGGTINQTRLGRMLLVNRSNVTGLIDRMEEAGWVRRHAEASDRRVKLISMTPAGRELVDRAEAVYFDAIEGYLHGIAEHDLVRLEQALELIRARIAASSAKPAAAEQA